MNMVDQHEDYAHQADPETVEIIQGRRRGWLALAIGAIILVAGIIAASVSISADNAEREDLEGQLAQTQEQVDELNEEAEAARAEGYSEHFDTTSQRHHDDEALLSKTASLIGTWDSSSSYTGNRDELMELLGLEEDDPLVSSSGMMPKAPVRTDASGATFSVIDVLGLNSRVSNIVVEPVGQRGQKRTYLLTFEASSTGSSSRGDAIVSGTMALTATLGADGEVLAIQGGPQAQKPIESP